MLPLSAALLFVLADQPPAESYTITIDRLDAAIAHVEGTFTLTSAHLFATEGTDRAPRLWADKIRHIVLQDSTGATIPVDSSATAVFSIAAPYRGDVHVAYDVDLTFTQRPWPGGNQRAGIERDSALYVIAKPLFLVPDTNAGPTRVSFKVPTSWNVATPWLQAASGSPHTYAVANYTSLTWNSIVLGRFRQVNVQAGDFRLTLALIGDVVHESTLVTSVLTRVVHEYVRIFPRTPPTQYLLTFFYYNRDDGEAFAQSSTFVTQSHLANEGARIWANTLAHELFHMWNPFLIKPRSPLDAEAWFTEGFTEYYANRTLARTHVIDLPTYLEYAGRHLGAYSYFNDSPLFSTLNIRHAADSDKTKGRFGVYDGGWTVALALDLMIRDHSHGAQSIDDFMRRMFERFPWTGAGYSYDDVLVVAREFIGQDADAFFVKYIDANDDLIPYATYLKSVGIAVEAEPSEATVFLHPMPHPDRSQLAKRRAWLGGL